MNLDLPRLPSYQAILMLVGAFFVCSLIVFGVALSSDFVRWDDNYLIYANPIVHGFTWNNIYGAFTTFDPELYIPFTFLSYQLDYTLGGLNPAIFHAQNLLLHTLNALLATWLIFLLLGKRWVAIIGGLVFLLHPIQTEAVMWASARKDLLSSFFFLGSCIAYIYSYTATWRVQVFSLLLFACALLAKVSVVPLPIILFLFDMHYKRRWSLKMIAEKIPFFLLAIIFGVVAIIGKQQNVADTTLLETVTVAMRSTTFYIQSILAPYNLSVIYPFNGTVTLSNPLFYHSTIIVLALFILVLASLKWTKTIFIWTGFSFLLLIPSFTNFKKGGNIYLASDRYVYLAIIGFFVLAVIALQTFMPIIVPHLKKKAYNQAYASIATILLSFYALSAHAQAQTWKNTFTLFDNALSIYPEALVAHINIGVAYRNIGELEKSIEQLEKANAIKPHARAYTALAAVYIEQKRYEQAIEANKRALELDSVNPEPLYGLALTYAAMNNQSMAREYYEQTIELEPDHIGAHNNLGAIELEQGNSYAAEEHYKKILTIDPKFVNALYNLGIIAESHNNTEDAITYFEKAHNNAPEDIDILMKLVENYSSINDAENTAYALKRILRIDPDHSFASQMLSTMQAQGITD